MLRALIRFVEVNHDDLAKLADVLVPIWEDGKVRHRAALSAGVLEYVARCRAVAMARDKGEASGQVDANADE